MATARKIEVELDATMVADTRKALGSKPEDSDSAAVERALNGYLLLRLIDRVQRQSGLSEQEANELAYEELRALRRERGSAA